MKQTALIVTILVLSVFQSHVSAQTLYREREEGEIILKETDITASKSSDDLSCLIDLDMNMCKVTSQADDGDYKSWFEFSLNGQTHCVTKIEVSMETTRRPWAQYRINCDNTGCSDIEYVTGAYTHEDGSDDDVMKVEVSVLEGEEEGTTDPACPGMVGNKVKFSEGMADLKFLEVWMFGGKLLFQGWIKDLIDTFREKQNLMHLFHSLNLKHDFLCFNHYRS